MKIKQAERESANKSICEFITKNKRCVPADFIKKLEHMEEYIDINAVDSEFISNIDLDVKNLYIYCIQNKLIEPDKIVYETHESASLAIDVLKLMHTLVKLTTKQPMLYLEHMKRAQAKARMPFMLDDCAAAEDSIELCNYKCTIS